jgi:hypothetical protein
MKNHLLNKLAVLFLSIGFIVMFSIGFVGCSNPVPDSIVQKTRLSPIRITHTHKKGVDPCPQEIAETAKIVCKTESGDTCTVDSVVLENETPGLTALFANGTNSIRFSGEPDDFREIFFTFTCAIAESFKHDYTLNFFYRGVLETSEQMQLEIWVDE